MPPENFEKLDSLRLNLRVFFDYLLTSMVLCYIYAYVSLKLNRYQKLATYIAT